MSTFSAPKGIPEYYPPASSAFLHVREGLAAPARRAGYGYIDLPMFEETELFARGVGESTDVVSKEMYTFADRGGRSVTLRPEGTAGVVRSVLEHNMHRGQLPVKLWYAGPFFRYERPQAGRYRQLQQVGVEALGSEDPALDAEVITIAWDGYTSLGLTGMRLDLNSLGCRECRPAYRAALQEFLRALDLDEPTRKRIEINPLRVLDDKRPEVQAKVADAPLITDHLCGACKDHFDTVRALLDDTGVAYTVNPRLVRGLDYYSRTTFEFVHEGLGAQSGIGGGGRYDGLSEMIGGPNLPGIGFGLGVDRTLLALEAEGVPLDLPSACQVYAVPLGDDAHGRVYALVTELRRSGVATDMAFGGRGVKGAMKAADRSGARFAVVLGDRDLAEGVAQLKDLTTGDQTPVALDALVTTIKEKLQ
ncbi:histidine--tRNA ligase [Mangrovactinospora gilvigrisea]|uniref:Histidine--tRNA ligase n=1 Tax=Mangrovactinospora gilvigrisea TaxID=1428644 RepID=A0A1J7BKF9_9ACTN|nr:histidine--tRNA ligase [Mangrovactinospora gilvigrisea]OIV39085.1 histidine--tRNA ligase [Mangrovactinospora gilvigrisea]